MCGQFVVNGNAGTALAVIIRTKLTTHIKVARIAFLENTQIKMNTIKRKTVTISLLDEKGAPVMTWTLGNAWPTKITSTDLKSDGNEVAIESIEIVHEGLTIVAS